MDFANALIASFLLCLSNLSITNQQTDFRDQPNSQHSNFTEQSTRSDTPFLKRQYFTLPDAQKILGEKSHLSDSSTAVKKDTLEIKNAFTADAIDPATGKTGVIYFMIEEYSQLSSAKNAYQFIKVANEKHEGVKVIQGMGDEAYYHSDGNNFYFYLVRKGRRMLRIKVNKITSHTSLKEFYRVAKKIAELM